jgi:S1-C subfamily serine protease
MPHLEFDEGELQQGVIIRKVDAGSPAEEAGLSEGDVVTAVDGEPIENPRDLVDAAAAREPGDTITLTILREDEEQEVTITLAEHPENAGQPYLGVSIGQFFRSRHFEGAMPPLDELPFDLPHLDEMPFRELLQEGVFIRSVVEDSPAAEAGLSEGDIITAVDGETITTPQDLIDAIAAREPGAKITLAVLSSGDKEAHDVQVTLAEHPDQEGQAYLGVYMGRFARAFGSEEGDENPSLQPFRNFLDQLHERLPFHEEQGPGFRFHWQPEPDADVTA